jgi:hypothetical protein
MEGRKEPFITLESKETKAQTPSANDCIKGRQEACKEAGLAKF